MGKEGDFVIPQGALKTVILKEGKFWEGNLRKDLQGELKEKHQKNVRDADRAEVREAVEWELSVEMTKSEEIKDDAEIRFLYRMKWGGLHSPSNLFAKSMKNGMKRSPWTTKVETVVPDFMCGECGVLEDTAHIFGKCKKTQQQRLEIEAEILKRANEGMDVEGVIGSEILEWREIKETKEVRVGEPPIHEGDGEEEEEEEEIAVQPPQQPQQPNKRQATLGEMFERGRKKKETGGKRSREEGEGEEERRKKQKQKKKTVKEHMIAQKMTTEELIETRKRNERWWRARKREAKESTEQERKLKKVKGWIMRDNLRAIEQAANPQWDRKKKEERCREVMKEVQRIQLKGWMKIYQEYWRRRYDELREMGLKIGKERREGATGAVT